MAYGPSQDSGRTPEASEREHSDQRSEDASLDPAVSDYSFPDSRLPNLAQIYAIENNREQPSSVGSADQRILAELRIHGICKREKSADVPDSTQLPLFQFVAQLTALEARAHYAQLLDRQERKNQGIKGGDAGGLIDLPLNTVQSLTYCIGYAFTWLLTKDAGQSTRSAQELAQRVYNSSFQLYKGLLNYWLQATCIWIDTRLDSPSPLVSISDPAAGTPLFSLKSRFFGFLSYIPACGIQEGISFLTRDIQAQRSHVSDKLEQEIRRTSLGSSLLNFVQTQGIPINLRGDLPPLADGVTEFGDYEEETASISISLNLFRSPAKLASVFIHEAMHCVDIQTTGLSS